MYFQKKSYINHYNGYIYIGITFNINGKNVNKSRRLHRLLAEAFIPNPDPNKLKYVGHLDNNKSNDSIENLYWTTNKDNTQKAVDDGININQKAENDSQSIYIKVLDKDTKDIVGIYGSMRQCARCIKNITPSFISKMCKKDMYYPRHKKYIYQFATESEFILNSHLKDKQLIESEKVNKKPKVFRMVNKLLNYDEILDNQVHASTLCNIPQAVISHLIQTNGNYNNWEFTYLDEILYNESSGYDNLINTLENITIQNINTNEVITFTYKQQLLDYFDIKGNAFNDYVNKGFLIMHEWKIINIENNNVTQ